MLRAPAGPVGVEHDMTIAIGQRIPSVEFKRMLPDGSIVQLDTATVFAGKKIVLFGLPGAFTPTCHKEHLPSYIARAAELKAKGVELGEEPTRQSYGIDFGFRDPFGNNIRIAQRP